MSTFLLIYLISSYVAVPIWLTWIIYEDGVLTIGAIIKAAFCLAIAPITLFCLAVGYACEAIEEDNIVIWRKK